MCAVLKTVRYVKWIFNEEECRSVGKAGIWWQDEFAVVLAAKPPGVVQAVQQTLGMLEGHKGREWSGSTVKKVKSKLRESPCVDCGEGCI